MAKKLADIFSWSTFQQ